MADHRLDIYPGGRRKREWPIVLFARRRPDLISVGYSGSRRTLAVNLHRKGGISFSGLPAVGGTSVMVRGSRMHRRVDELARDCVRFDVGPLAVCSGQDF